MEMRLLRRRRFNDLLYLMPVKLDDEQLPRDKVRMLCCDVSGRVYARIIDKSEYETARRNIKKMGHNSAGYATLGLEIGPGVTAPLTIVVSEEELWALGHILDHAIRQGIIPNVLKKYPRRIIGLGETKRSEIAAKYRDKERRTQPTPEVLERLPYYQEEDIELSIPVYKAEHRYPVVVLGRIAANEKTPPEMQRLLILDSDGDLAVIRVPLADFNKTEKAFEKWKKTSGKEGCIVYSQRNGFLDAGHLVISKAQRNALDLLARYFGESGYQQQSVPSDVYAVLTKARGTASFRES